jgi:hypothetical protein
LSILRIQTAKVFEPLLGPARYKGGFGGRGSGKSHFFGELLVEICQAERGTPAVCIREAQRTLAQSSKRLIESKIASLVSDTASSCSAKDRDAGRRAHHLSRHAFGTPPTISHRPTTLSALVIFCNSRSLPGVGRTHYSGGSAQAAGTAVESLGARPMSILETTAARWLLPPGFFAFCRCRACEMQGRSASEA